MAQEPGDSRVEGVAGLAPRLRPPVQLRDPFIRAEARFAVAGFDLSILPDADTDQPSCATNPETLTFPSPPHHPRIRGQGRHVQSLTTGSDLSPRESLRPSTLSACTTCWLD
jgi:hypothetical protein